MNIDKNWSIHSQTQSIFGNSITLCQSHYFSLKVLVSYLLIFISKSRKIDANLRDMYSKQWSRQCSSHFYQTGDILTFLLTDLHCEAKTTRVTIIKQNNSDFALATLFFLHSASYNAPSYKANCTKAAYIWQVYYLMQNKPSNIQN